MRTREAASVVVCTRDRPDDLRRCLTALAPLAAEGHEVIVVDNAPRDDRASAVASTLPCRYLREPIPGLDHARNRGLAAARHDLVAFTDDDCAPEPGWLAALTAPYADPEVGATTGLVLPLELDTSAQVRFEAYCANRRIFTTRVLRAPHPRPAAAGIAGMGANMAFRKSLLLARGGFDVRLDAGTLTLSGGDTDAFARILDAGASIVYRPDAVVRHRHRRDEDDLRRAVFGYGVGLYAFLTKRLVEHRDPHAIVIAARWLIGPPVKAAWNTLRGRPASAPDLVWAEVRGALHGPFRFARARREAAAGKAAWRPSVDAA
jgi:glycosyltransferase involved in cell wall biosynthesis